MADAVANQPPPLLAGVRVLEVSMLGPGAVGGYLADLGADVVKIEPPQGDYIRQMTWPIIDGVSLMHLHLNRGKRSLVLNLENDDARAVFRDLARDADVVIEAMRPGALARMGLGYGDLVQINPKIVFCTVSGYGMTGPYASMPSHGIAYDTWAGIVMPEVDDDGFTVIPEHVSIGINAAPPIGAAAILAAVIRARGAGVGAFLDLAQSDAAAYFDWYRSETWLAYRRPKDEVTGNPSDDYARRAPGTAGMRDGVRYQLYESADGHVLFMASEQAFWKNFCEGVGRIDLFERWPGSTYADHARGNRELQAELRDVFKQRTSAQWLDFADEVNTPIAPVNTPQTVMDDPQFQARLPLLPHTDHGADMLPFPVRLVGEDLPLPTHAPTVGEHTDDVLRDLLGLDHDRLDALRAGGALG